MGISISEGNFRPRKHTYRVLGEDRRIKGYEKNHPSTFINLHASLMERAVSGNRRGRRPHLVRFESNENYFFRKERSPKSAETAESERSRKSERGNLFPLTNASHTRRLLSCFLGDWSAALSKFPPRKFGRKGIETQIIGYRPNYLPRIQRKYKRSKR